MNNFCETKKLFIGAQRSALRAYRLHNFEFRSSSKNLFSVTSGLRRVSFRKRSVTRVFLKIDYSPSCYTPSLKIKFNTLLFVYHGSKVKAIFCLISCNGTEYPNSFSKLVICVEHKPHGLK